MSATVIKRIVRKGRDEAGANIGCILMDESYSSPLSDDDSRDLVEIHLRYQLEPGDIGRIVEMHGTLYATEYGFDSSFEAFVAGPLAECVRQRREGDRIWIARRGREIVGCIAIVGAAEGEAQLRWFLVAPSSRGAGLGKRLLEEAVEFARGAGYQSIFLWTVAALTSAARLYQAAGFRKTEEKAAHLWGVYVVEERYCLWL